MKTFLPIIAIACGILLPYGHSFTFVIRYLVMAMLFFAFLEFDIDKEIVTGKHFIILLSTVSISIIFFTLIKLINFDVASAVFIAAIGPTAIASPVIVGLQNGNVRFVVFSLLLENISVAVLIPFLMPFLMGNDLNISISQVLTPVFVTLFVPFAAGRLLKLAFPAALNILIKWKGVNFYLLAINIYLASSRASYYIVHETVGQYFPLLLIGFFVLLACAMFFSLGKFIGGQKYGNEASFSLGQKNNGFTIWVALTFMNPLAVIGPIFYVLFQNIYISLCLFMYNKLKKRQTVIV